jgi:hypothetical protein
MESSSQSDCLDYAHPPVTDSLDSHEIDDENLWSLENITEILRENQQELYHI